MQDEQDTDDTEEPPRKKIKMDCFDTETRQSTPPLPFNLSTRPLNDDGFSSDNDKENGIEVEIEKETRRGIEEKSQNGKQEQKIEIDDECENNDIVQKSITPEPEEEVRNAIKELKDTESQKEEAASEAGRTYEEDISEFKRKYEEAIAGFKQKYEEKMDEINEEFDSKLEKLRDKVFNTPNVLVCGECMDMDEVKKCPGDCGTAICEECGVTCQGNDCEEIFCEKCSENRDFMEECCGDMLCKENMCYRYHSKTTCAHMDDSY